MVLKMVEDAGRYGNVMVDPDFRVVAFREKTNGAGPGLINGGLYLVKKLILSSHPLPQKFSLEKDFFEKYLKKLKIIGFESNAMFIDIGIPEDYAKAQQLFK